MRWSWVVLVIPLLAVVACTSQVDRSVQVDRSTLPHPRSTPAPPKLPDRAADLIGSADTLDACSLLDPAALSQFGSPQRPEQESYDYCWLQLPMSGAIVAVRFGLLEKIKSVGEMQVKQANEVEQVGALRVFEEAPVPDRCARYILFSDNVTLAVSADTVDSPGTTVSELCAVTEKATSVIAENIAAKKLTHQKFEATSMGTLDACKAVTTSLAQVPGLAVAEVTSYPAHHQCRWGSAIAPSLTLRYVLSEPFTAPEVKHETIAGKATGVYNVEVGGRSMCVAEVKGTGRELAQVVVRLAPNNAESACVAARVVAGEVWSKLPAAS